MAVQIVDAEDRRSWSSNTREGEVSVGVGCTDVVESRKVVMRRAVEREAKGDLARPLSLPCCRTDLSAANYL